MKWVEKCIPEGTEVRAAEMLYKRANSNLVGLRLLDKDGLVLCSVGGEGDPTWDRDPDYQYKRSNKALGLKRVTLADGQYLCGIKSSTIGSCKALSRHFDFLFVLGHIE